MPATVPCAPQCCPTTQTVQVPGGEGLPGLNGTNGFNAFSIVSAPFVVPAIGGTVTVAVLDSTQWMVVGEVVVAGAGIAGSGGPAHFLVSSVPSSLTAVLQFLGYAGDVAAAATIGANSTLSPSGSLSSLSAPLSVVGAGTAYAVTATPALINLGTTDPSLTITSAGTWLLVGRVRFQYNGATFAAVQAATAIFERTNNTPGAISNSGGILPTQIVTTYTKDAGTVTIVLPYTTTNVNDILELWASVSVVPSAGSLDVVNAEIYAQKLF